MLKSSLSPIRFTPILKQNLRLKLKPLSSLNSINIFALPSRVQDKDILAMFKGLLRLMQQKAHQDQAEKYLNLELKYNRLKYLYNKSKIQK